MGGWQNGGWDVFSFALNPSSGLASSVAVPAAGTALTGGSLTGKFLDKGGFVYNVKASTYGAKGDGVIVTDGAITGSVFTTSQLTFTSAHIGLQVCVTDAGTLQGGANGGSKGLILSLNSSSSVNLDTAATVNVSGKIATIGTDDTAAIQAAINDAIAAGGGTVYRPASTGKYLLNGYTQEGGSNTRYNLKVGSGSGGSAVANIRLLAEGSSAQLYQGPGGSTPAASSFTVALLILNTAGWPNDNLTLYAFNAVARGDQAVTITTAGQAANFAVGDVIWLRSGATGSGAPNGEMNIVTSVNAGTGVIGLKSPTAKAYAAAGTYGAGNATSQTGRNLVLENEWQVSVNYLLQASNIIGLAIRGGYFEMDKLSGNLALFNYIQSATLRDAEFVCQDGGPGIARSSIDILIEGCRFRGLLGASGGNQLMYFIENSARCMVRDCQLSFVGGGLKSCVEFSDSWACVCEANYIFQASGSTVNMGAVSDLAGNNHELEIRGNWIEGMTNSFLIFAQSDGTVIEGNRLRSKSWGIKAQPSASTNRIWLLGNRINMVGSSNDAYFIGGASGHDCMCIGNIATVESGSPGSAVRIASDGVQVKSATVIGNYAKGFTNGLKLDAVASEVGLYVLGNDLSGCTTAYNPTNPMGGVVAITPGASPYTYTANTTSREMIYIDGGTVTTVVKNGITLFSFGAAAARCSVLLAHGEAVVVTYSVVPTMNKDRVA